MKQIILVIDQGQLYLHTLHMVANVDHYTNQVSPLYPCRRGKKRGYMVQLKCWQSKVKLQLAKYIFHKQSTKPDEKSSAALTCELHCHLSSLSFAMLILYLVLNQAAKSPNHASSLVLYICNKRKSETLRILIHQNSVFLFLNQDVKFQHLLLCIKMLYTKILIPNKNVVIGSNNVRMQKTFGIPPWTNFQGFM